MCQALCESDDVKKAREAKIAPKQRKSERAKNGGRPHVVFRTFRFFFTVIDTFSPLSWSLEEATCENVIEARRPDIIVMKKKAKKCTLWKLLYLEIVG